MRQICRNSLFSCSAYPKFAQNFIKKQKSPKSETMYTVHGLHATNTQEMIAEIIGEPQQTISRVIEDFSQNGQMSEMAKEFKSFLYSIWSLPKQEMILIFTVHSRSFFCKHLLCINYSFHRFLWKLCFTRFTLFCLTLFRKHLLQRGII